MTLLIEIASLFVAVVTILLKLSSSNAELNKSNVDLAVRLETRLTSIEATIKQNHDMTALQLIGLNNDVSDHETRLRSLERQILIIPAPLIVAGAKSQAGTQQATSQEGH